MTWYKINKGVGRSIEVKGLRAQYVLYCAGGAVASVILFFILSLIIGNNLIAGCICGVGIIASLVISIILNNKYGELGLTQVQAERNVANHIRNTKRVHRLVKEKK